MGIKTVSVSVTTCDKEDCGKVITNPNDAVLLKANLLNVDGEVIISSGGNEIVCLACLVKAIPNLPVKEKIVEKVVYKTKTVYEDRIVYQDREENSRSGGASGPLLPPELPHYVSVAKKIAQVK